MEGSARGAGLLFWIMTLAGGVALVPCVLLPPWFEYVAQRERLAAMQSTLAHVEQRLVVVQKQIEHIQTDAAYVERLYRQEFGAAAPVVPQAMIASESEPAPATSPPSSMDAITPEVTRLVDHLLARYPAAQVFVQPQTRPIVMLVGGGLIVAAVVLLGRVAVSRAGELESEARRSG